MKRKKMERRRQEGVSPPPCPTPNKIFFGQGSTAVLIKFRVLGNSLYPNRGRQSGGAEPRERDEI
jgi:hypothetical protein